MGSAGAQAALQSVPQVVSDMTRPAINWQAARDDDHYRSLVAKGHFPATVRCPVCGLRSLFQNDLDSARFVCDAGHITPAPMADPQVNPRWWKIVMDDAFRRQMIEPGGSDA